MNKRQAKKSANRRAGAVVQPPVPPQGDELARLVLRSLVDTLDAFERLLAPGPEADVEKYRESVRRAQRRLLRELRQEGLVIGEPGETASPETHQVIMVEQRPDLPEDSVLSVVQRGFRHRGYLVRPATVTVSTTVPARQPDVPEQEAVGVRVAGAPGSHATSEASSDEEQR